MLKRLRAGGEGRDRGWDVQIASPIQWTWVWANSRRQWRTGKPRVLQSMGSQRVGYDLATEQQHLWCWRRPLSPVDCKIKSANPKGNQPWIFTGKTDAEAEAPTLGPLDTKSQLTGKDLMLEKIEGGRRRGQQRIRRLEASLTWLAWVWASSRRWWRNREACYAEIDGLQNRTQERLDWTDDILNI